MFFVTVLSTILELRTSIEAGIITFIFWCILFTIFRIFTYKRINGFLIVDRKRALTQSISLKICFKNLFRNVFDNKRLLPKRLYTIEVMRSNIRGDKKDRLEIYFENNKGKILKTYTNNDMLSQLRKYEKKELIEIKTIQAVENKSQKLARLCYVGIGTIIYNCRNENFKEYIKKEIEVGRYEVIIK